jgi:hypothetical protein
MRNLYPVSWWGFWWYKMWSWVLESLGGSWWMVCLGWIFALWQSKENHMQMLERSFWDFFCKFCPIARGNCEKVPGLDIMFIKAIHTKQDFEKKSTTHLG